MILIPFTWGHILLFPSKFQILAKYLGAVWELQRYTLAGTSQQQTNARSFDNAIQGRGLGDAGDQGAIWGVREGMKG